MNRRSHRAEWRTAVSAVKAAAVLCQTLQPDRLTVLTKPDGSLVSAADVASQALICDALAAIFPRDPIVAEEDSSFLGSPGADALVEEAVRGLRQSGLPLTAPALRGWLEMDKAFAPAGRCWVLDPLDGSRGFLAGRQYAVALALVEDGEVQLAVLACPQLARVSRWTPDGTLLAARAGEGTWTVGGDLELSTRLHVSSLAAANTACLCESVEAAHTSHAAVARVAAAMGTRTPPLRLDSQVKYALVAAGGADAYLRPTPESRTAERPWDHAAGALLVTEAGGRVTDLAGRPLRFTGGRFLAVEGGIAASNGALHDDLLAAAGSFDRGS